MISVLEPSLTSVSWLLAPRTLGESFVAMYESYSAAAVTQARSYPFRGLTTTAFTKEA